MTNRSTTHTNFTIQRMCRATPTQVFAAFSEPETKSRWQDSPEVTAADDSEGYIEFDFRVGGHERFAFKMPDGPTYSYDAEYYDIVPDQRIVYCYKMYADGAPDSISLVTIELTEGHGGTALTYTEQGTFLDGVDDPALREEGLTDLLDNLTRYLAGQSTAALPQNTGGDQRG